MDWSYLFEISLTGIASGGLYALAALAFVSPTTVLAVGGVLLGGAAATFAMGRWMDDTVDRARRRRTVAGRSASFSL